MDTVTQIKQQLNIVDVIGSYIEVKKAGKNYKAVCPFHGEKTPSFMISPDIQMYKCFGCGEHGDIFNFVQKIEGIEFMAALENLAEKAGVKVEKTRIDPQAKEKKEILKINELTANFYQHLLTKHKLGSKALKYAKERRKLEDETIKSFTVGFAPDNWDTLYNYLKKRGCSDEMLEKSGVVIRRRSGDGYIDKFRNRLMFPLVDISNKVVGFTGRVLDDSQPKYLNSPETLVFHKTSFLYGLDKAKIPIKKKGVVFVEGQLDVLSAYQANIQNVVAASGTALTIGQLKMLSRYTNEISFCFDPDDAGRKAMDRAIDLAEKQGFSIKTIIIPEKFADLDELVTADATRAEELIKDAVPIYDFFVASALKSYDKKTAQGKKKIIEDLAPRFARISNKIVQDHYIKLVTKELDVEEQLFRDVVENGPKRQTAGASSLDKIVSSATVVNKKTAQKHILSLLFRADLETVQNILYKLGKNDFPNETYEQLFSQFKEYVIDRKRQFDIKLFIDKLTPELAEIATELCLVDLGEIEGDSDRMNAEIDDAFKRVKQETISRELKALKEKLKQAELEKNAEEIEVLQKKVYKFSKQKRLYG